MHIHNNDDLLEISAFYSWLSPEEFDYNIRSYVESVNEDIEFGEITVEEVIKLCSKKNLSNSLEHLKSLCDGDPRISEGDIQVVMYVLTRSSELLMGSISE